MHQIKIIIPSRGSVLIQLGLTSFAIGSLLTRIRVSGCVARNLGVKMSKDIKPLIPVNPQGLDEIAKSLLESPTPQTDPVALNVRANINKSDYVRIPGKNILIRKEEIFRGKNWTDTHYELSDNGLFMPSPEIFIPYFLNVKNASEGKSKLYDGNNHELPRNDVEDIWKYLTTGHRKGCWTWLDSLFTLENNIWYIKQDHRTVVKGKNKELQGTKSQLEQCLREDAYVNLDFNKQGLPKTKSSNQNYSQGNNIYYWHPRDKAVARFRANSDRANLDCDWDSTVSDAGLGVFACAAENKE